MLVRAPLVEAEQHGSIRIQDLTKVVMVRRRLGLAEERLVPFEAARNVTYADDRPCAFHRISAVGLTNNRLNSIVRYASDGCSLSPAVELGSIRLEGGYRGPFAGSAMVATDSSALTGGPARPYMT
jgi:hypothetical protein